MKNVMQVVVSFKLHRFLVRFQSDSYLTDDAIKVVKTMSDKLLIALSEICETWHLLEVCKKI